MLISVWKRAVPATSRLNWGLFVLMPTLDVAVIVIVGVVRAVSVMKLRGPDTPVSNLMLPVVCRRIWSEIDEPLNKRSSDVVVPVLCSATTVLLYSPTRPQNLMKFSLLEEPTKRDEIVLPPAPPEPPPPAADARTPPTKIAPEEMNIGLKVIVDWSYIVKLLTVTFEAATLSFPIVTELQPTIIVLVARRLPVYMDAAMLE